MRAWLQYCTICAGAGAAVLAGGREAYAGAWTQPKGHSYHRFAGSYYVSTEAFSGNTGFDSFEDYTVSYYGEAGVAKGLNLFASLPYRRALNRNFGEPIRQSGVGDAEIGLRLRLLEKPLVVSAQAAFKAPYFYNADAALPLGNGQEDLELRMLAGKSIGRLGYLGAEIGFRKRLGAPTDEVRYLVEYGGDITRRSYVRTKLDGTLSTSSTKPVLDPGGNPRFPLAFNLARLETTLGWRFSKKVAMELTTTTTPFGANTIKGTTFEGAVVLTF